MTDHELPPDVAARMAERVAALQAKRERNKADRNAFAQRRAYGVEARHRAKLARQTPTLTPVQADELWQQIQQAGSCTVTFHADGQTITGWTLIPTGERKP